MSKQELSDAVTGLRDITKRVANTINNIPETVAKELTAADSSSYDAAPSDKEAVVDTVEGPIRVIRKMLIAPRASPSVRNARIVLSSGFVSRTTSRKMLMLLRTKTMVRTVIYLLPMTMAMAMLRKMTKLRCCR